MFIMIQRVSYKLSMLGPGATFETTIDPRTMYDIEEASGNG